MNRLKGMLLILLTAVVLSLVLILFIIPLGQTSQASVYLQPYERHIFIFNDSSGTITQLSVINSKGEVMLNLVSPTGEKIVKGIEVSSSYTYTFTAGNTGTYTVCVENSSNYTNLTMSVTEQHTLIDFL